MVTLSGWWIDMPKNVPILISVAIYQEIKTKNIAEGRRGKYACKKIRPARLYIKYVEELGIEIVIIPGVQESEKSYFS